MAKATTRSTRSIKGRKSVTGTPEFSPGRKREQWGRRAGAIGMIVNFSLFAFKLTAGLMSGSIAVVADAVNNLTDAASSAITYVGFRISGKPADKEHPFGHARMEYVSGFLVSVVVVFLGLQLGKSSIEKIIRPQLPDPGVFMIAVLVASIAVKLALWIFYLSTGRRIGSVTLIAAASDSRNDVAATSAILLSLGIYAISGGRINPDGLMGLLISLLIIAFGVKLVIDTISPLLGVAPPKEIVTKVHDRIMTYEGVIGLHDLAMHSYGYGKYFASVHCEVPAHRDIMESHDLADNIERDIKKEMNINLVIHLDPIETGEGRTSDARDKVHNLLLSISPRLSMHDFRAVWSITHTNFIFDIAVPFDFELTDEELSEKITDGIFAMDPTYFAVLTFDRE
ncbi:MAG: cation diffusion facilitator family transporter [Saccharofermentanales bacterium]